MNKVYALIPTAADEEGEVKTNLCTLGLGS